MKARALVVSLVLLLVVPAGAQHGGGAHSGGFGAGHFGGRFSGHRGHKLAGAWGAGRFSGSSVFSRVVGPSRLTTVVGFGSAPGSHLFIDSESFFCPVVPHLVFPFCRLCGLRLFGGGFFGFPGLVFFDDSGQWLGLTYSQPGNANLPPGGVQSVPSILVFTNGRSFEVTDYWIDDKGKLRYVTTYGAMNIADLQSLDLYATVKRNAERGIPFTLKLRHGR